RTALRDRAAGRMLWRAGRDGLRLPLRPWSSAAVDRVQRGGPAREPELLRLARLGGAAGQLRGDRTGEAAARELVRPWASADQLGRQAGAALVERVDVRVLDAAADHALVRAHAARRVLWRRRGAADRVRPREEGALGYFGVGLQQDRRPPQLSVSRVRRAWVGVQARPRRCPGRGALRQRDGPDDRSRVCLRESRGPGARGPD